MKIYYCGITLSFCFLFLSIVNAFGQENERFLLLKTVPYEKRIIYDYKGVKVGNIEIGQGYTKLHLKNNSAFYIEKNGEIFINLDHDVIYLIVKNYYLTKGFTQSESIIIYNSSGKEISKIDDVSLGHIWSYKEVSNSGNLYMTCRDGTWEDNNLLLRQINKNGEIVWERKLSNKFTFKDLCVANNGEKIAISQGYYGEVKDTNNVIFVFDDNGNKIMEFTSFEVYSNLMFAEEGIILSGENSKLYKLDFNCKIAEIPISSVSFVKDNNLLIPLHYNFVSGEIYLFKFLKDKPQELIIIKKMVL